ncbi:diaminopropionate ammonia-lyase [Burkholderia sp. L27(2015)]|uniref:diaminopropionate ammonia-lyase n=1 Tax=Burkholderia sp. L27(2015) TaxID=1641858 RepID=UPI00131B84FA|nr:diaminopropionate ammonia-lyase [Burkholderia sp. L27(2015)]
MLVHNASATRRKYDDALREVLNQKGADESRRWLSTWDGLNQGPTPLWRLPDAAERLQLGSISVKDEGRRSDLGSFKALGAPIALVRLIRREWPAHDFAPQALFSGAHAAPLQKFTVISATDGNHGRALAAAARSIGCRCVIVLHRHVSEERRLAIEQLGAQVLRIEGNYDESVREAARLADEHGWYVVSDTSYDGYETIPRDVMQGYGAIAAEAIEQEGAGLGSACAWTHVFIQGGVGGLAAGVVSYLVETYGENRPTFVVVEPQQADCLYQSALSGHAAHASGSTESVMAGLACGDTSPLAWRFLREAVDYFMTIPDEAAIVAMRCLADGASRDIPIIAGESGAAGLAGLMQVAKSAAHRATLGLGRQSQVLLLNTEGATAPILYGELVGKHADHVLAAQTQWAASVPEKMTLGRQVR